MCNVAVIETINPLEQGLKLSSVSSNISIELYWNHEICEIDKYASKGYYIETINPLEQGLKYCQINVPLLV